MIISPIITSFLVVIFYQTLVSIFELYNEISYLKFIFFEGKSLVNRNYFKLFTGSNNLIIIMVFKRISKLHNIIILLNISYKENNLTRNNDMK